MSYDILDDLVIEQLISDVDYLKKQSNAQQIDIKDLKRHLEMFKSTIRRRNTTAAFVSSVSTHPNKKDTQK